ncbi:acyl-CoA thioesterase [Rhodococcus erythropolis]|uniref:acyl-CoA thioesterase n=1 Tax=Rhodococcus erythropolis TaxID=1833 RepID=UPI0009B98B11|nr:thioesterase family protein [Rhodococcus erythropolis]
MSPGVDESTNAACNLENTSPLAITSAVVTRTVEWQDTDAAGHYHHRTILRWVEAAEAELLDRAGLRDLFGAIPRVRYEADYQDRIWFGDVATIHIDIIRLGRSSMTYAVKVYRESQLAATASLTAVHAPDPDKGAQPWPAVVHQRLGATNDHRREATVRRAPAQQQGPN